MTRRFVQTFDRLEQLLALSRCCAVREIGSSHCSLLMYGYAIPEFAAGMQEPLRDSATIPASKTTASDSSSQTK
jgi:hypothetical protein